MVEDNDDSIVNNEGSGDIEFWVSLILFVVAFGLLLDSCIVAVCDAPLNDDCDMILVLVLEFLIKSNRSEVVVVVVVAVVVLVELMVLMDVFGCCVTAFKRADLLLIIFCSKD